MLLGRRFKKIEISGSHGLFFFFFSSENFFLSPSASRALSNTERLFRKTSKTHSQGQDHGQDEHDEEREAEHLFGGRSRVEEEGKIVSREKNIVFVKQKAFRVS